LQKTSQSEAEQDTPTKKFDYFDTPKKEKGV